MKSIIIQREKNIYYQRKKWTMTILYINGEEKLY